MWPWKKRDPSPVRTALTPELLLLEFDDKLTRQGRLKAPNGFLARERVELGLPRAEIDEILAFASGFAMDLIERDGNFAPFAVTLTPAGVPALVLVNFEGPTSGQAEVDRLVAVFRAERVDYRAVAIASDYTMPGTSDEVFRAFLEHRLHPPVLAVRPYRWEGRRLRVDEVEELEGIRQVFPESD
jgi:hypothetical protein